MKAVLLILLLLPLTLSAQFTDNFTDGDFTNSPEWVGETNKFRVENEELQLFDTNDPPETNAWLTTISESINNASWEFLVRLDFNPSSSNYCNIYLVSNQQNLNNDLNGYFVKIGNTTDEISLYRQDGGSSQIIIDGTDDRVDMSSVNVSVKVSRDATGQWTLESDTLGGNDYYLEGSVSDATYLSSSYFGVSCTYTATRKDKMFFDNISVSGTPYVDNTAPVFTNLEIIDNHTLLLNFNEPIDAITGLNASNYLVNNGINSPNSLQFEGGNTQKILLSFSTNFNIGTEYNLQYQNIEDLAGNEIVSGDVSFSFYEPFENMLVINEIMADPTPEVGLPVTEFIEIYNRQNYSIDLNNWKLKVGSTTKELPLSQISANGYAIICDQDDIDLFLSYGTVIGIESMQALINGGTNIVILDPENNEINQVIYSDDWYQDIDKDEGGWTLEQIDPDNTCGGISNWRASESSIGGTPGYINSIDADNIDIIAPIVNSVQVSGNNHLTILFSEETDTITSLNTQNYTLSPDFAHPDFVQQDEEDNLGVNIFFPVSFAENTTYTLTIENISDNCGNTLLHEEFEFVIYHPSAYDIIISEIMPDPSPIVQLPDAEYIELYNRSEFPIELTDWILHVGNSDCELPFAIIEPHSYITLVDQDDATMFNNINNVLAIDGMPLLSNSGTTIALQSKEGDNIYGILYSDNWYDSSFKAEGGWSLEMIDPENPCGGANNWRACEDLRGGTPSEINSIDDENIDFESPMAIGAEIVNTDTIRVFFNEPIIESNLNHIENYWLDHEIGHPVWAYAEPPLFESVLLKFNALFIQGEIYYLEIADTISDCANNNIVSNSQVLFAISDSVTEGDILINEILFNPYPNGYDFVEIYNNSDKLLDLKKIWIAKRNDEGEITDASPIREHSFLLLPETYCAITMNPADIGTQYYTPYPENIVQADHLPSLPNTEGYVILLDRYMLTIDETYFNDDMHFELLADENGVSLERISFEAESMDRDNWFSAAETAGFATPGYENSQAGSFEETSSEFSLESEIFSPDNDGVDDRLAIRYAYNKTGSVATIAVYNSNGLFITWISENTSLGKEGVFYWDGLDNRNIRCSIGIYIIYAEIYNPEGEAQVYKLPFVLSIKN